MKTAARNPDAWKLAGLALIPVFLILIGLIFFLNIPGSLESPLALAFLNTLLLGLIPLIIAYLTYRVVARSGSLSVFLLGSGVLIFGLGSIAAGLVSPLPGGPNMTVTIHNTCACIGSILIFAGAVNRRARAKTGPGGVSTGVVATAYSGIVLFVAVLTIASILGMTPPFFLPGSGPTMLRQVILENAVLLFAISSGLFFAGWQRERSDFIFWYAGAFALIGIGLLAVFIQPSVGSLIGWTGRFAQYIGCVYALNAILIAGKTAAKKGLPIEEVIADFFTDAEQSYTSLVETATDAIVVFDADERIIVWNRAAELMTEYRGAEALGSVFTQLVVSPESADSIRDIIQNTEVPDRGTARSPLEITAKRKDGSTFPAELALSRHSVAGTFVSTCIIRDITERKKAEENLRYHASLVETISDAVISTDTRLTIVSWNRAAEMIYGWRADEVLGKSGSEILMTEFPCGTDRETITRDLFEKGVWQGELIQRTKDGDAITVEATSMRLKDEMGRTIGAVSVSRNITEKKKAEDALAAAHRRTRTILEGIADTFYSLDDQWRFVMVNPAAEKAPFGRPAAEMLGKSIWDLYPALVGTRIHRHYLDAAARHTLEHYEAQSPLNGRWYEVFMQGQDSGVDVYMRDITQRKQAEEAFRQSEEKYRNLVKFAPAAIYEMDLQGTRFLSVNRVMCEILGYEQEELMGVHPVDLLDEESRLLFARRIRKKLEGDLSLDTAEYRVRRKDGTWIYADINVGSFTFADNKPSRVVVVGHDITWRKRMEEELIRKNEDLIALNEELTATQEELHQNIDELGRREQELGRALQEKEVLLSEIHHRVKNNLTAFISLLSLEGSMADTPEGKQLKLDLQNRARSMALVHETLYRTHLYNEVDMGMYLTTLVDQIGASFRTTFPVTTVVDAPGVMLEIPRATPAGLVINELVTNSFKYAFPASFDTRTARGAPPTIAIALAKNNGMYEMTVKDNGIGFPPGFDLAKTKTLGLKLVNFLATHQMRATVEVRSDHGAEFRFRFREEKQ